MARFIIRRVIWFSHTYTAIAAIITPPPLPPHHFTSSYYLLLSSKNDKIQYFMRLQPLRHKIDLTASVLFEAFQVIYRDSLMRV